MTLLPSCPFISALPIRPIRKIRGFPLPFVLFESLCFTSLPPASICPGRAIRRFPLCPFSRASIPPQLFSKFRAVPPFLSPGFGLVLQCTSGRTTPCAVPLIAQQLTTHSYKDKSMNGLLELLHLQTNRPANTAANVTAQSTYTQRAALNPFSKSAYY